MLEPLRPGAVSPDRALCLPTFSHFLIVNKTSLSLSLVEKVHNLGDAGGFVLLDFGSVGFTIAWASGPKALSARCSTVVPEVIAEVHPTLTVQAVQDSWMGLVTRRASGVWVFLGDTIWVLGFVIVV